LKDILKRIFSSYLADGPILAGNTFSAIQPKLNSLAVQTELTLLDSKMERSSKDLTEARELIQLLIRLILNSKLHTDDSSNNQINKSTKGGSKSSTTLTSDQRKKSTKAIT